MELELLAQTESNLVYKTIDRISNPAFQNTSPVVRSVTKNTAVNTGYCRDLKRLNTHACNGAMDRCWKTTYRKISCMQKVFLIRLDKNVRNWRLCGIFSGRWWAGTQKEIQASLQRLLKVYIWKLEFLSFIQYKGFLIDLVMDAFQKTYSYLTQRISHRIPRAWAKPRTGEVSAEITASLEVFRNDEFAYQPAYLLIMF